MNEQVIDAQRCPLCGQLNACVMAAGGQSTEPCWCVSVTFSAEVLSRVPPEARHQACICARCASATSPA